jgi:C4-dicarboxylate-specific signal transduction histidine kinase
MEKDLGEYVTKVETTYKEMRDTLLGAVGSGLGLTIVFHEMERGVRDLHRAIDKGDRPDRIRAMASHLVELLHGASFLIRTTSKKSHNASEIVAHALMSQAPRFAYHKINSTNGFTENPDADFKVKGSHRMLVASAVNLLDNAIYWLNALHGNDADGTKRIWIGPCYDLEGPAIVVADTGPGLEDEPAEVVKPFFTRKPDGMGIGLYFANMAMKAHGGRLAFLEEGEADIPKAYKGLKIALVLKGR